MLLHAVLTAVMLLLGHTEAPYDYSGVWGWPKLEGALLEDDWVDPDLSPYWTSCRTVMVVRP